MLTERHKCKNEIAHALSSYFVQVKMLAAQNLTDSAREAEETLVDIVNIAYNSNFVNLNTIKPNFPGIDWRETNYRTGMQVSVSNESAKIKKSIDTLIRNKVETSRAIWFLILTIEGHGQSGKYEGYDTQVITFNDLLRQICALPDDRFYCAVKQIREKLGPWLPKDTQAAFRSRGYKLPPEAPVEFINFHNLWEHLESREEVPVAVLKQLKVFAEDFSKLPPPVQKMIARVAFHAPRPSDIGRPLEIDLDEFYYHIEAEDRNELEDILGLLTKKSHGGLIQKNTRLADDGEGLVSDHYIQLDWFVSEPDMYIYSALKMYYLDFLTDDDFYKALECADFSLLK